MPAKREVTDLSSALYKAADRNQRRYGLRAALFLVVALVAALGSAVLLTRYMEARTEAARVPTVAVMVAAVDLPVGTELHGEQLRPVEWPSTSIPEGSFQDVKDLEGKMVAVRVYKGEPILPALLAGSEAGKGLSALLPAGLRAAAVRVDDIVGVAGFIHPGDSVDVIVTMRTEGSSSVSAARVILQNIKVLAVGKDLDAQKSGADKVEQATVATLLVTAEESERLALASAQGKILLTLRGAADTEYVATKGVNPNGLLVAAEPPPVTASPKPVRVAKVARPEPPAPVIVPAPPRQGEVVEILRGDLFERRDFQKEPKP
jgi:pilus assembly protein CpaB